MKAAIFDMDGLLFDSETIFDRAWKMLAENYGFYLDPKMQEELRGCSGKVMRNIVNRYLPNQDAFVLQNELFENALSLEREYIPIKPGVFEILDYFKSRGFKLAIASSSPEDMIKNNLKVSNTKNYFDVIVNGREVENGKPSPDIFLLACEKLGFKPEECFVFEDAIAGVAAGVKAGCKTIMIPDLVMPTVVEKETTYGIFNDLNQALSNIKQNMDENKISKR